MRVLKFSPSAGGQSLWGPGSQRLPLGRPPGAVPAGGHLLGGGPWPLRGGRVGETGVWSPGGGYARRPYCRQPSSLIPTEAPKARSRAVRPPLHTAWRPGLGPALSSVSGHHPAGPTHTARTAADLRESALAWSLPPGPRRESLSPETCVRTCASVCAWLPPVAFCGAVWKKGNGRGLQYLEENLGPGSNARDGRSLAANRVTLGESFPIPGPKFL